MSSVLKFSLTGRYLQLGCAAAIRSSRHSRASRTLRSLGKWLETLARAVIAAVGGLLPVMSAYLVFQRLILNGAITGAVR